MVACALRIFLAAVLIVQSCVALTPSWAYPSWDDKLPVFFYGSNCTGYDSARQLAFNARHDMLIYLFPVNQGNSGCAANRHCEAYMLSQADANKRVSSQTPVLPYASSMPLALAFYDDQASYMPSVTKGADPSLYLHATNGSVLGPYGNTDLWFDFRKPAVRNLYVQTLLRRMTSAKDVEYSGWTDGAVIGGGQYPECKEACSNDPHCVGITWIEDSGDCTRLSSMTRSNADSRWSTWTQFADSKTPVDGLFFDDVDWGVCGAIRQYSNDTAVTDELLQELYDGTVENMVETAQMLNLNGKIPIYAVTNGFFDDAARGGTILPNYRCPRPYEHMFNRLQQSGVLWARFYEFQWPAAGGGNCDLVLRTAAREAAMGVPLVVHGNSAADLSFQLAGFLATGGNYSYFGISSGYSDKDWTWHAEYDEKWGAPLGNVVHNGTWYYRELRNTHVHVDCASGGKAHMLKKEKASDVTLHFDLMMRRFPSLHPHATVIV